MTPATVRIGSAITRVPGLCQYYNSSGTLLDTINLPIAVSGPNGCSRFSK